jgi:hypothetical protein
MFILLYRFIFVSSETFFGKPIEVINKGMKSINKYFFKFKIEESITSRVQKLSVNRKE